MPHRLYVVREVTIAARPVAGVRAKVRLGRVGSEFGRYLDQVYAAGKSGAVSLDGQNVFIYRSLDGDQLTCDFCVGVKAAFTTVGNVEPLTTPSGQAAMTTHVGDYGRMGDANAAIKEWCRANNRAIAGPSWEVYGHFDPKTPPRTDVYYLLKT